MSLFIQTTPGLIAIIQTFHIAALATVFISGLLLALRVAGHGLTSEPLGHLAHRFVKLIWMLLVVLLVSGLLLIIAEPARTITNPAFYWKMAMLAAAIIITLWLSKVASREGERPSPAAVAAGYLAVLLWAGIMIAGRLIAYTESL
ncbi:MAG: hypothetical protein QM696_01525 [Steroidobacteraceae bacterium]